MLSHRDRIYPFSGHKMLIKFDKVSQSIGDSTRQITDKERLIWRRKSQVYAKNQNEKSNFIRGTIIMQSIMEMRGYLFQEIQLPP